MTDYHVACDGFYYSIGSKSWTASGIRTIADDLSTNGTKSRYYSTFHSALMNDAGRGKLWIHDANNETGEDIDIRLIGINQDVKADGSGQTAGLTFQTIPYNDSFGH